MKTEDLAMIAAAGALVFVAFKVIKPAAAAPAAPVGAQRIQTAGSQNGWQYFDNGTAIDPSGAYYFQGVKVYDPLSLYG